MKYIDNRINANIVKLEDENNNYMSEDVEGALEEIDSKIKNIESHGYDDTQIKQDINNIKNEIGSTALNTDAINIKDAINEVNTRIKNVEANGYDDTQIRQNINDIKTEIGTEELTTTDQTIKGAVNEVNTKIKENVNKFNKQFNTITFNTINIIDFGAKCDGITDDTESLKLAINELSNNCKLIIPQNTVINGFVPIHNKGDITIEAPYILGDGKLHIQSDTTTFTNIADISEGASSIEVDYDVNEGDYLILKGYVKRTDYTPNRFTESYSIHKIIKKIDNILTFDTPSPFGLTSASIAKISNPYSININVKSQGVAIDIINCIGGTIDVEQTKINNHDIAFNISNSRDVVVNSNINNSKSGLGLMCNDVHYSKIFFNGKCIGSDDLSVGSKSFRGNGLVSTYIDIITEKSNKGCSTIYGSKKINLRIISSNGGILNRLNNITDINRLESVQFSECDDMNIECEIINADDQALELLACKNVKANVNISTLENSSEGAVVIKGGCKNISLINPKIKSNNNYALKIEGTNPDGTTSNSQLCTSNINIYNPYIEGIDGGVAIRDYGEQSNSNVIIEGGVIKANTPLIINANSNSNEFKGINFTNISNHCLLLMSNNNKILSCNFYNTEGVTRRAVSCRGILNVIRNCNTDGGYIYLGGDAVNDFKLKNYSGNNCDIFLEVFNGTITSKRGFWETAWLNAISTGKVFGVAEIGDVIKRTNPFSGDSNIEYWICNQEGSFASDNFKTKIIS